MLLGSILLALAWAALRGEITLLNLLVGYVVGYAVLALLARGGVMPSTLLARTIHASQLVSDAIFQAEHSLGGTPRHHHSDREAES